MSHHRVLEYIQKAKTTGASDREIADRLYNAGWYRVDIQDGLELHRKMTQTAQLASVTMPEDAKVAQASNGWLVAVAVVACVVGFIGYVLLR